jgi:hypothetical protein
MGDPQRNFRFCWYYTSSLSTACIRSLSPLWRGATTLSITTFSIMTLTIECLNVTLSVNDIQHKITAIMLSIIMLSVAFYSCGVSLCWMSLCWVSLCWMSLCWMSWRLCRCLSKKIVILPLEETSPRCSWMRSHRHTPRRSSSDTRWLLQRPKVSFVHSKCVAVTFRLLLRQIWT